MRVTPELIALVSAQAEPASDTVANLLRVALLVVLVVLTVILLALLLRPIVPVVMPTPTDAEQDERTLRRLGLSGEVDRHVVDTPAMSPPALILFPRPARSPIHAEDERVYHDPVIAARLKHVLSGTRHERRRANAAVGRSGETVFLRPDGPTSRAWPVGDNDRGPVRHTSNGPSSTVTGWTIDRDQELPPMPPRDIDPSPDYIPVEFVTSPAPSRGGASSDPRDGHSAAVIEGVAPSSADLERLADGPPQPRSKVVPFIPRHAPAEERMEIERPDPSVISAVTATVRELLFCSNVGEYLHGFALYSDRYLFRFMDETGMTADEFRAAFEGGPAREPEEWTRLSHLSDARRLEDGRVAAVVSYLDGSQASTPERYAFVFDDDRGVWLIDDIEPA